MATKKDLVEAHAFNRRRLVTTFLSGAPGGREVEPVRYARVLIGGLILAVLVVAGAAVSGYLKPPVPKKLSQSLIISTDSGSHYVYSHKVLYPIANVASARLFAASNGGLSIVKMSDDDIGKYKIGFQIGIQGAPETLPATSSMVNSGWVSCANDHGAVATRVSEADNSKPATGKAVVVADDRSNTPWLVSGGYRYQLPPGGPTSQEALAIGMDGRSLPVASHEWVGLFDVGTKLSSSSFDVRDFGRRVDTGVPALSTYGQPFTIDHRPYVLIHSRNGKPAVLSMTPFAMKLYLVADKSRQALPDFSPTDIGGLPAVSNDDEKVYPQDWPTDLPEQTGTMCATLAPTSTGARQTVLSTPRKEGLVPDEQSSTGSVSVARGKGALVSSSGGDGKGAALFLVDSTGTRFAVGGTGDYADAQKRLGYAKAETPGVPRGWLELLNPGPDLTVAKSRETLSSTS